MEASSLPTPTVTIVTIPVSLASSVNSPNPSALATPASEPVPATRYITPLEAFSPFLQSFTQSAEDFLGNPLTGVVITVPSSFTPKQRSAHIKAAKDASTPVLNYWTKRGQQP